MPERSIEDVMAEHTLALMGIDGVEGVGRALCDGRPCIRVFLRSREVAAQIPRDLEGYMVSPVVTGMIRPL